ncbi:MULTISPECIES: hypothetical protein [Roseateles]|uniref:hypothetical protein n=1 Tax=Roseateles TaxID=93681 RepID=UPI0010575A42|nr:MULTISPECIES: hypothetical protein [Roseateles]WIV98804.1 hypothetical protein K9V56_004715 [Paucibacter aquatile]
MANTPGKRPAWNRLSASELERERALVREKERLLRQRLARQEKLLSARRPCPQQQQGLELLRERVEGMQTTAQALRARSQQR